MIVFSNCLVKSEDLEKKNEIACSFNNAKCEFIQGRIFNVERTNVSFIEAHRVNIKIKNKKILLLYFDKDNLFLYDRSIPITIEQLYKLLEGAKYMAEEKKDKKIVAIYTRVSTDGQVKDGYGPKEQKYSK